MFIILYVITKENNINKTHTLESTQLSTNNEESLGNTQAAMRINHTQQNG